MNLFIGIQDGLLALLCYGTIEEARRVLELIPARTFDAYYSDIARKVATFIDEYGEAPGEHTLDLVESACLQAPKRARLIRRVYESITTTWEHGVNTKFMLDEAATFARHRDLKDAVVEVLDQLEKNTKEGVQEADFIWRRVANQKVVSFDEGVILQDTSRSLQFLDLPEEDVLPVGVPAFDEEELGPVRGGLHLLISAAKRGKSWWLFHLMRQAILHGLTPLYIGLELRLPYCCRRAFQSLFSLSRKPAADLMRASFDLDDDGNFLDLRQVRIPSRRSLQDMDAAKQLIERMERFKHRPPYMIKCFPSGSLTMRTLEAYLDHLVNVRKIVPDLVCIDYPDLMKLDARKDKRDAIGQHYVDLRGLADERNFIGATVSQLNRPGAKDSDAGATDVAEDWSKIHTVDGAFVLNQTKAEKRLGVARLTADAIREGPGGFDVLISQQLALGQFIMDSVRMNRDAAAVISGRRDDEDDIEGGDDE